MNQSSPVALSEILTRLTRLEDMNQIRQLLTTYMALCDQLNHDTPLDTLANLFSEKAIWEGLGAKYQAAFGRYQGRDAIYAMFESYITGDPHFVMNAHFLTSENIQVDSSGVNATGGWLMLQTSTFQSEKSHLNSARLTLEFIKDHDQWFISHFQTENIFSRAISNWNSHDELSIPVKQ